MTAFIRRENALPRGHRFDGGHAEVLVHGRTNDAPTACIQVPQGRLWHLAGHRHVLCGIQRRYVSFRAVPLRESANDRQSLSRKTSKDLELELDPFLRIEPIHGQPCVTESIESKARRLDGRMDDVCLAMVISSNACLDVLAVHDDAVARSHRTTVPCSVDGVHVLAKSRRPSGRRACTASRWS